MLVDVEIGALTRSGVWITTRDTLPGVTILIYFSENFIEHFYCTLESVFLQNIKEIDALLDEGSIVNLESCIETLENLCLESPNNPELLWRLGKTHYLLLLKTKNHEHLQMGIDACSAALKVEKESSAVHKWMAMLIGERTKIQPFKEKALDGMLFKKHLDEALRLDNTDPLLHHMLGRFSFDVADLKWYEKKIASALFELPPGTFEDALASFEEAERLCKTDWLENILFIAKCQIKLNRTTEALEVLQKAELIQENNYLKVNQIVFNFVLYAKGSKKVYCFSKIISKKPPNEFFVSKKKNLQHGQRK